MKKTVSARRTLRISAILLLLCMLIPQFAACTIEIAPLSEDPGSGAATSAEESEAEITSSEFKIPEEFAFQSTAGFFADGNVLRMDLADEASTFDLHLSNRLKVKKTGAVWCLTSDENGTSDLSEKNVTLSEGENVFYVKVSFKSESFIYKAIVTYHSAYTVEFYSNCSAYVETQKVKKGATVEIPAAPSRAGYSFLGWYLNGEPYDFSKAPAENITLIAHWSKNDNNYYTSQTLGRTLKFTGISAGLHIVWKDYADANALRPEEVTCVLTQSYGTTQKTYGIILAQKYVVWEDPENKPDSYSLAQGAGGDWTLSLSALPEKVGNEVCTYTLVQTPLSGDYTTLQSGTAVVNTLRGYDPSVDPSAKLTTRNSRLYDAAGNMIVFQGVVTYNIGWASLDDTVTPASLQSLSAIGCNAIRVSMQVIGTSSTLHNGYVYHYNGSSRTKDYSSKDTPTTEEEKKALLAKIDKTIETASNAGVYIIIDWAILTSNPYQYVNEASEFFGILAEKYKDNPYVLFEICNEPGDNAGWIDRDGKKGIRSYTEIIIDIVRQKGSDAIIITAPRGAAKYLSLPSGGDAGDDPIRNPLDDDRSYNVAFSFHSYSYNNAYSSFGYMLRDAYDAGLTVICTETSPMDSSFDKAKRDLIGYDMAQISLYMRVYQEYDMGYFYFRYGSAKYDSGNNYEYSEWVMFQYISGLKNGLWTKDDLTACGKWYYDLVTGDGVFVTVSDYNATMTMAQRNNYKNTFAAYGLAGSDTFTAFPTFAIRGASQENGWYFTTGNSDSLLDAQYEAYCKRIWRRISEVCDGTVKQTNGSSFTSANIPASRNSAMQFTYQYSGTTYTLRISYKQNTDSTWGIFFSIQ